MKVFFLNRKLLKKRIKKIVVELAEEKPELRKVVLFGSVAEDRSLPSSDVDVLFIVESTNLRFLDSASEYLSYFQSISLDVDCFVYTEEEVHSGNHPMVFTAFETGITLFQR